MIPGVTHHTPERRTSMTTNKKKPATAINSVAIEVPLDVILRPLTDDWELFPADTEEEGEGEAEEVTT